LAIARAGLSAKFFTHGRVAAVRGYVDALIVAALVALFLTTFVVRTFYIPSVSMVPTLQVRDVVLVDEVAYRLHRPADGDVAVFNPPVDDKGSDYVKRVIGVPGDALAISNGTVYRNGAAINEPYENETPNYDLAIKHYEIYVDGKALDGHLADVPPRALWQAPDRIPNDFYFVLGDNRNYSDDSHVWGFVPTSGFIGRAFMILWPFQRLRALTR
jgi:signal peptidase I